MIDGVIRRLLASPWLRRARVERDDRGRVTEVSATLGPDDGAAGGAVPPDAPEVDASERAARADAARWLDAACLRDAADFALGEERAYAFDQAAGTLTFRHADGASLVLPGQILGSFRPQDGSFRWGWANPGVAPAMARAALDARARMAGPSFHAPTFPATFAEARALAGLAARLGGCDGAYRAVTDDHLTVFVGYGRPAAGLPALGMPAGPEALGEAVALLDRYDVAMLPHDVEAHERGAGDGGAGGQVLRDAVAAKQTVYERFWRRDDAYWEPSSVEWPSPHDPAERRRRFALPRRAGGAYVVTQLRHGLDAHVVERVGGAWRITDLDLDWGRGLLLLDGDELAAAGAPPGPAA